MLFGAPSSRHQHRQNKTDPDTMFHPTEIKPLRGNSSLLTLYLLASAFFLFGAAFGSASTKAMQAS